MAINQRCSHRKRVALAVEKAISSGSVAHQQST
jgi:hypothetical protein